MARRPCDQCDALRSDIAFYRDQIAELCEMRSVDMAENTRLKQKLVAIGDQDEVFWKTLFSVFETVVKVYRQDPDMAAEFLAAAMRGGVSALNDGISRLKQETGEIQDEIERVESKARAQKPAFLSAFTIVPGPESKPS